MREGTAWIAEDWDPDDSSFWSGLFSAIWNGPSDAFEEGPQHVPHAEAIAWGRSRADVVLIRSAESDYHSAGLRQPDNGPLPEWPVDARFERRRPAALAYMDRTEADDPILWALTLTLSLGTVELGGFPAAFNAAVGEEERAGQIAMAAMRAAGSELCGAGAWSLTVDAVPADD